MTITRRALASSALSVLFVLAAARPGPAHGTGPAPLAQGRGTFFFPSAPTTPRTWSMSVTRLASGQIEGHALNYTASTGSFVLMRVTSAVYVDDSAGRRSLAAAGLVAASSPDAPAFLQAGRTTFFAVQEGGFEGQLPDTWQGLGNVPQHLGNLTIQQILALIPPPPAAGFVPIVAGDLMIRNG
ncbi:MAG TPA: hypothetical protein VF530_02830 [Planctomycetota bacterium]